MGSPEFTKINATRYEVSVGGKRIAFAQVRDNYIYELFVDKDFRRLGVTTALVRFISKERVAKLNRAPSRIKNDKIHALSAKLGSELLDEAR